MTPGPWFAGKTLKHPDTGADVVSVGPFEADVHYEDTICEVWGENHPAEANARLIAEAPNLLAACKLLIVVLEDDEPEPDWRQQVIASAKRSIDAVSLA